MWFTVFRVSPVPSMGYAPTSARKTSSTATIVPSRRKRDPRPVDLLAVVARGGEVLAPPLDPLHGPPEAEGDGRHEELLVIDGALRAEAAAHVGGEHPHLLGRDPEDHGHGVAHEVGILGGRPDDQQAGLGVPVGEDAARLDRHGRDPRMAELFLDDQVGGGEGPLDVADRRRARRRRRCRASRRERARPRARRTRASSPAGAGRSRPRSRRGRRPADRRRPRRRRPPARRRTAPRPTPGRSARRGGCWASRRRARGCRARPRAGRRR